MTRWACFPHDRRSCRIETSLQPTDMDGRNTHRAVRYHGRLGFTRPERELLPEHQADAHRETIGLTRHGGATVLGVQD